MVLHSGVFLALISECDGLHCASLQQVPRVPYEKILLAGSDGLFIWMD